MTVTIRGMLETDVSLIVHSFGKSAFWGNAVNRDEDRGSWLDSFKPYVQAAILYGHARIACLTDDPDVVLGWALFVGDQLEFVYVKKPYRNKGVGTALVAGHYESYNDRYATPAGIKWIGRIKA